MTHSLPEPLAQLLSSLGVPPQSAHLGKSLTPAAGDYLVLPSPDRPQLLVPCVPAAGVIIAERRAAGLRAKTIKTAFSKAMSSGVANRLPLTRLSLDEPGLSTLIAWITSTDPSQRPGYSAGILVGPPRANRKPVLRVFTPDGVTWGYAKLGLNDLTDALISRETDALRSVAEWDLRRVRAPQILKAGVFGGHQVLATSPLATESGGTRQPSALPVEPTREIFQVQAQYDVPLRAAPALATPATVATPSGRAIEALATRLLEVVGDDLIPLGAGHGDWTPWNMAWAKAGSTEMLEAWDWERAALGVPQGHDVVHFEVAKIGVGERNSGERDVLAALPARLAACGIDSTLTGRLLASYLVVIGRRYAGDLALEHVASLNRRLDWVITLLERQVTELERAATIHSTDGGHR